MRRKIYKTLALSFILSNFAFAQRQDFWTTYTTAEGLADNDVHAIIQASDGALWFGTLGGGASRYQDSTWTTFTTIHGLINNHVNAIIESRDGTLWFGTSEGVSKYRNGNWTTLGRLAGNDISAIIQASDGSYWFGTQKNGVTLLVILGIFEIYYPFTRADGLVDNDVNAVIESSDRAIWFGTRLGVSRTGFFGGFENYTTADGLADNWVDAIMESSDGALWFGTHGGGVSRYQDSVWTTFNITDGLASNFVASIIEDDQGALWFGTQGGGVSRFYRNLWTTFTNGEGLANDTVNAIIEDGNGSFWFGTANGLSQFKGDREPPFTILVEKPASLVGTRTVTFVFSGRDNFSAQNKLLYSWALIEASRLPRDEDWASFASETFFETPPLKNAASYTFYIRTMDELGNIDPSPETIKFTVDLTSPTALISFPQSGAIGSGKIPIIGSAFDNSPIKDFLRYELSYGSGADVDSTDWITSSFLNDATSDEVRNDTLAIWGTEGLPNGPYWLQLSVWDTLGHESHDFVRVEVVKAAQEINARRGTNFFVGADQLEIYIPPNAVPENVQVNVRDWPLQSITPPQNSQVTFLNLCFAIHPDHLQLAKPATLTLSYPDSTLINRNESKLALYYSQNGKDHWQRLGGSIDLEKNKITATFKSFGVFALYEDLTAGGALSILNVTSQPRLFSPQGGGFNTETAISFDLGKESNVSIKVYNAAGRLVRVLKENEAMRHGTQVVYWNGKDEWSNYCQSGLYVVTIQAEEKMATKTVVIVNK